MVCWGGRGQEKRHTARTLIAASTISVTGEQDLGGGYEMEGSRIPRQNERYQNQESYSYPG